MAYSGEAVPLELFLFQPEHNLIEQSMSSRSAETPTNGDGFGVGWYAARATPGLFRSIRPAWNDFNLRDLAAQIDARLFLAHVRATSLATVQETNCHPFRWKNWLFVHNGEIFEVEKLRRDLLMAVAPEYFGNVLGTTDSEVMFHLALTFGLHNDPVAAVERMVGFVESVGQQHGVQHPVQMTVAMTDGERMWVFRYSSEHESRSLYFSTAVSTLRAMYPDNENLRRVSDETRIVVSEPLVELVGAWQPVPESSYGVIQKGADRLGTFRPSLP